MQTDFNSDRVTLVKSDGHVTRKDILALVVGDKIFTADETLPLEVGDHLLRQLPNGLVEDYEIINPRFFNEPEGFESHFQIEVQKVGTPKAKKSVIQGITNNFTGPNARVNMHSIDNSINVSSEFSPEQLRNFIDQVRPVISHLPEENQGVVDAQLSIIEDEANKQQPSKMLVLGALQSIKSIAEGASGNLVAAGVIHVINILLQS